MTITNPRRWGEIAAMLEGYESSDEERPSTKADEQADEQASVPADEQASVPASKRASDIKPECPLCNRTFRTFQQLLKHTDAVHKLMTKQCTDCGKKFSSGKALAHHRQICTPQPDESDEPQPEDLQPDEPQPSTSAHEPSDPPKSRKTKVNSTCNVCGRSFSSQKQLLAHHDAIHQSMDLQCDECGKSFASSQLLAQHHLRCSAAKRPRGGQVGRGHLTALQNNAAIESVTPTHNHDILMACKEVEPKIIDYLKKS